MIRGQARNSCDSRGQATDRRLVEVSKYLKSEVAAEESKQWLPPSIYQGQLIGSDIEATKFVEL
jgi:hypothetical protein